MKVGTTDVKVGMMYVKRLYDVREGRHYLYVLLCRQTPIVVPTFRSA